MIDLFLITIFQSFCTFLILITKILNLINTVSITYLCLCPLSHPVLESAKVFMEHAVAPGTRASNLAALSIWEEFRRTVRDSYGLFLDDAPNRREAVLTILKFIVWAVKERQLTSNAVRVLCGKLRWNFTCNVGDASLFDHPSLRTALKGMMAADPSVADLKKSPNHALLWVLALNDMARDMFWVPGDQDDRMSYIGGSLAFNFSLRIGEVANVGPYYTGQKCTPDHRFYWCDIILESETKDYKFAEYKATETRPHIELILFVKNTSKTSGRANPDGKPYYLTRNSKQEERLLEDLLTWIEECNHNDEALPIACRLKLNPVKQRDLSCDLHSKRLIAMMNTVGMTQGLKGFSGKSLRGGGSSSLAAAGHSDSVILNSVGHKSLASNQHYQSGTASGNAYALGAGNPISIKDVRRVSTVINLNQSKEEQTVR